MSKYEVIFHYGDTGFEENLTGEIFNSESEAQIRVNSCNKHISCEDYELGDYYYARKIGDNK